MNKIYLLVMAFFVLTVTSCEMDEDVKPEETSADEVIVKEGTVIVSKATNAFLVSVEEDKIVFKGDVPQLDQVQVGNVLVSDI
ncbi:MAG: hypothetical protein AAF738_05065, partial [Bacteroidota bacterium]